MLLLFVEHEKVTKAIRKKKKKKKKKKQPCVTCGALLVDGPMNRYQHRSRSRECFEAYKRLHS